MINKSIFLSKTFWVQVAAILAVMFPAVQAWLSANPVSAVAALAAVNVLVRFVTSGKVSLSGDDQVNGFSIWGLLAIGAVAVSCGALASCSDSQLAAARSIPIKACYSTPEGRFCYSSKGGVEVDVSSAK